MTREAQRPQRPSGLSAPPPPGHLLWGGGQALQSSGTGRVAEPANKANRLAPPQGRSCHSTFPVGKPPSLMAGASPGSGSPSWHGSIPWHLQQWPQVSSYRKEVCPLYLPDTSVPLSDSLTRTSAHSPARTSSLRQLCGALSEPGGSKTPSAECAPACPQRHLVPAQERLQEAAAASCPVRPL